MSTSTAIKRCAVGDRAPLPVAVLLPMIRVALVHLRGATANDNARPLR